MLIAGACTSEQAPTRSSASTQTQTLTRDERWTEDVRYLVEQMEALHPDLDHGVSLDAIHEQADALVAGLSTLDDDEVLVGIMRLVAMISADGRDGHMGVWPPDNPQAVHRFPIRVWEFPDGLFVTGARTPDEGLVGSRIVSIEGHPVGDVFARLDPVVPRDNASNLRAARTVFLTSGEVLAGLGITEDRSSVELEVERPDGGRRTATIRAVDAETFADWVGGWELLLPGRPGLLYLDDPAAAYHLRYLPGSRTLYLQYNVVGETSSQVANAAQAAMRAHPVDRVVLDLRNNGGGEAGGYRSLLRYLTSPQVDRPGGFVVLIGRLTFSGAASLAVLLEDRADNVVFAGEASGGAPNFWADPDEVTLPNSGLRALIATRYFGKGGPDDQRTSIEPDIEVPLTAADYFVGRDPVLERATG
jgi:hypothetical protein